MPISLHVKPGPGISRDEFLRTHAPYSIALDGYVSGEPFLVVTGQGPWRNFNHHEAVDRSCTSATCEQARRAVLLGLYDLFRTRSGPEALLHVNDCDQDACLATFILMNPDQAAVPFLRQLTQIEDLLDVSSGGIPMPHETDLMGRVRWVFAPYTDARPRLAQLDAAGQRAVIDDVHSRIQAFLVGEAGYVELEGTYEQLAGGPGWILAKVDHMHAREKIVAAGFKAAIELSGRVGGNYAYSLWRRSEYVVWFPVRAILRALNAAEGYGPDDHDGWGGADNVGGSPRQKGSRLTPDEVAKIVEKAVAEAR